MHPPTWDAASYIGGLPSLDTEWLRSEDDILPAGACSAASSCIIGRPSAGAHAPCVPAKAAEEPAAPGGTWSGPPSWLLSLE